MKWSGIIFIVFAICFSQITIAQKSGKGSVKMHTISGKVTVNEKIPVSGAVFYIDNVKTSYITKSDGTYRLKVSPEAVKIMVKSSEYGSEEATIEGQKKISFNFENNNMEGISSLEDNTAPEDAGQRKRTRKMNTYNDIYQMIRGEVSGVLVNGTNIIIQQQNSFFGSTTPLFVVNGVVVNTIDYVNPLEVKSIEVLTGSKAAIWGVRGANGVISITLVNGSENEN